MKCAILEAIEAAITAAETGHLVFGTLHTTGAAKTIDRITNAFPTNQQEMVRIQLSTVMQAVHFAAVDSRALTNRAAWPSLKSWSTRRPSPRSSATTKLSVFNPTSRPDRSGAW